MKDFLTTFRELRRSPRFTVLALVVLAIGLTLPFCVVILGRVVLLAPIGAKDPTRLRFIYKTDGAGIRSLSFREFVDIQRRVAPLDLTAAGEDRAWTLDDGQPAKLWGSVVTGNYFGALGVNPIIGRVLDRSDDSSSSPPAIVISEQLWTRRFHRDQQILGKTLTLRPALEGPTEAPGQVYHIVGVLPVGFRGTLPSYSLLVPDYWVAIRQRALDYRCPEESNVEPRNSVGVIVRVPQEQSILNAKHRLESMLHSDSRPPSPSPAGQASRLVVTERIPAKLPDGSGISIDPKGLTTGVSVVSLALLGISLSNVIGLFLYRILGQKRQFAIRLALGATPASLTKRCLYEVLILAFAGAIVALPLSLVILRSFYRWFQITSDPITAHGLSFSIGFDPWTASQMILIVIASAILVSLRPAFLIFRVTPQQELRELKSGSHSNWLPRSILVPQIAIAIALLAAGSGAATSLLKGYFINFGYEGDNVIAIDFSLPLPPRCKAMAEKRPAYVAERNKMQAALLDSNAWPSDVQSVAVTARLPTREPIRATVATRLDSGELAHATVRHNLVSERYFSLLAIPVIAGRTFESRDSEDFREPVFVVSANLAQQLWPGQTALDRFAAFHNPSGRPPKTWGRVIGVVADTQTALPAANTQAIYQIAKDDSLAQTALVKLRDSRPESAIHATNFVIKAVPGALVSEPYFLRQDADNIRLPVRLAASLFLTAGVAGMILALLGIVSVLSLSLRRRMQELAVRIAIGAQRIDIVRLVFLELALSLSVGIALGTAAAIAGRKVVSALTGVHTELPAVSIATAIVLSSAVLIAISCVPAWRAASKAPLRMLQSDQ